MPLDATTDPPFMNLARQANKLMEQMQKGYFNFCPSDTWTPNVNLYETADEYLVCVDLAGVEKEKIDVEVRDNRLRLTGSRPVPRPEMLHEDDRSGGAAGAAESAEHAGKAVAAAHESGRIRVHLMEIDHGSFCREVELPLNVDRDRIVASYRNGVLWIEIPKG